MFLEDPHCKCTCYKNMIWGEEYFAIVYEGRPADYLLQATAREVIGSETTGALPKAPNRSVALELRMSSK